MHSLTLALDGRGWPASHPSHFTPLQEKSPQYPLNRRLGGPPSWSGHGIEEKYSQPPLGIEPQPSDHPTHSQ